MQLTVVFLFCIFENTGTPKPACRSLTLLQCYCSAGRFFGPRAPGNPPAPPPLPGTLLLFGMKQCKQWPCQLGKNGRHDKTLRPGAHGQKTSRTSSPNHLRSGIPAQTRAGRWGKTSQCMATATALMLCVPKYHTAYSLFHVYDELNP